jgi:hypothetical protein
MKTELTATASDEILLDQQRDVIVVHILGLTYSASLKLHRVPEMTQCTLSTGAGG